MLASCRSEGPSAQARIPPAQAHALIEHALPHNVDVAGWADDIYAAFHALSLDPDGQSICAVIAVIQQESSFRVDPIVPNLGAIALKEIDSRAAHAHVPLVLVHGVLALPSGDGRSYAARIEAARTEKDLSDIYEEFIGSVPLGRTLFEDRNPIRTRGPMQVNVAFAEQFSAVSPYPYPVRRSIPDELFTRRGSVYFGVAHLLDYQAPYPDYIFRFADYNAGQYASRNAAFQRALSAATGIALKADGALLPHADAAATGNTERAARALGARLNLGDSAIHAQLAQGKTKAFEETALYEGVFALADKRRGAALPRAVLPSINLTGPKLRHSLSTQWYAERVDQRFKRCLAAS